ncbi:MAG: prolyl oligopeptidase family serine peptidase [Candidatus Acidiferrales bacterium]
MRSVLEPPPVTPIEPITDVLHGVEITDPYRWLEDQNSPRTRQWIEEQTAYTRAYLDAIPGRDHIRKRVEELLTDKDVIPDLWKIGARSFFLRRQRNSEQHSIVMKEGLLGEERVLVDPSLRATGPSTAVSIAAISQDGRFLAYSVRQGGTDHAALEILDVENNVVLPDRLPDGFCTGPVFAPDASGFYYSHREVHDPRPNYKAAFWHRFGAERSQDEEVFVAGEKPDVFLGILDSLESKLLAYVVYSTGTCPRTSMYLHRMEPGAVPTLLLENIDGHFTPFFVRDQLFAYTDVAAPNFRIVRIGLANPDPAQWRDVVPESHQRIQNFAVAGEQIFVTRTDRFSTRVERFDLNGGQKKDLLSSAHATVDLLNPTYSGADLFYRYTSMTDPSVLYCHDTHEEKESIWDKTKVPFDPSLFAVEEVVYPSKDGTSIPLLLAAREDLIHSGPLPTFLTGYGGFGSCVTPRFTAVATFLMEQGFLFAVPALRGGSELGEEWHFAGKRDKRQNSFDDFIAAAEWLLSQGRSALDRIAIGGGSNAGLLVGAAVTQRPDLFRAAICLGPLLDMTRYHLFDRAAGWAEEYGSPEDEQDFHCLLNYSPYHRVQDGAQYPAVLLISGDADTRCNPMHARKMAARLQAANRFEHPILLDYKPAWGHTPVQPLSVKIESLTDRLAFVCHELGVSVQPRRSA